MAEQDDRPKIEELNKFSMFANLPGEGGKRPRLGWSVRDMNPRITVFTNSPADTVQYGIISAPMNPETFFVFLELLEKVALGPNDSKFKIECYTSTRQPDGTYADKTVQSELVFGKDPAGIVWLSVIAVNRPKVKFEFKIYDYHKIFNGDGTQMDESESSSLQALGVVKALKAIYAGLTGGLRQNKGGGGKSFNKPAQTFSNSGTIDISEDVLF